MEGMILKYTQKMGMGLEKKEREKVVKKKMRIRNVGMEFWVMR